MIERYQVPSQQLSSQESARASQQAQIAELETQRRPEIFQDPRSPEEELAAETLRWRINHPNSDAPVFHRKVGRPILGMSYDQMETAGINFERPANKEHLAKVIPIGRRAIHEEAQPPLRLAS